MLMILILVIVGAGAYWLGAQSKSSRIRDDERISGVAGPPVTHTSDAARPWLIAGVVGGVLLLAVLLGGPAMFGPMGGPGLFGP